MIKLMFMLGGLTTWAYAQEIKLSANPDLLNSTSNDYGRLGAPEFLYSFTNDYGPIGSPEFLRSVSNDYGTGLDIGTIKPILELIEVPLEVP